MRVIRTEMFFDSVEDIGPGVSKAARMNPGVQGQTAPPLGAFTSPVPNSRYSAEEQAASQTTCR